MKTTLNQETNRQHLAQAVALCERMLSESLVRGFFGKTSVEITIQDGTIQGVARRVEQHYK